jgi:hypothetical protein
MPNSRTGPSLNGVRSWVALAAVICAAMVAGCGSSDKPSAEAARGGPLLKYAQCMRSHGVPNFPDPSPSGGLVVPNDINVQSPAFKAAQQACGKLAQPASGAGGPSESRELQLLELAKCMRSHGVPNFPDPTTSPPPPSSGNVIGGNGWYLALGTAQERQSPAYRQAAATCQLTLR